MLSTPTQLDSRVEIVTPENIAFQYRLAGPFARIGAYLLDLLVLAAIYFGAFLICLLIGSALDLPGVGVMVLMVLGFVAYWFYSGVFEWRWNGQTPGKRMTGLRVLRTDGRPIAAWQAILRNLLRYIDLFPYVTLMETFGEETQYFWPTCLVGLTAMACSPRYQRVGDLACNTMVVAEEPSGAGRAERDWLAAGEATSDPALQKVLQALPVSYRPSRTLARVLSHYAGRRRYLGPARRREIARHVGAPLVESLGLPPETDHDLLLCALYVRTFLTEPEEGFDIENVPPPPEEPTPTNVEIASNGGAPRFAPLVNSSQTPAAKIATPATAPVPGSPEFRARMNKPATPTP